MAATAHGLPNKALMFLAVMQCLTQGVLVTLLATFLTSKSSHQPWFKVYVIFVNVLCAGQTVLNIIQAFNIVDLVPQPVALVAAAPVLTGVIGASVQAFFIRRCWKIYDQRILPIIPLLLLWLASLVSSVAIGGYGMQSAERKVLFSKQGVMTLLKVWIFTSFIFDLITTLSTIFYLYRVRKGIDGCHSVFGMVWQVMWASAAPPLILMTICIIDGYVIPSTPKIVAPVSAGMTGKFFALSLMISLVGQKYIREQFEQNRSHPFPPQSLRDLRSETDPVHASTVIQVTVHTVEIELQSRMDPGSANLDNSSENHLGRGSVNTTGLNSEPSIVTNCGSRPGALSPEIHSHDRCDGIKDYPAL
ncbi:hypothetical protein OPQ81_007380 [Rhizoctonia solani]|nr:hypothetical protein OPQ81_007380 [Rhizoctonia solani]